jgi:hypothetical protein
MHNFRRAERETLRVLKASSPVDTGLSCKVGQNLPIVKNPSGGGVASSKRLSPRKRNENVKPIWSELPLAYVRPTRSHLRRVRKVKSRRAPARVSDSKRGTVWDVIPRQAEMVKKPVMGASDVPKDVRYWSLSFKEKQAVVEFWLRARIRRCRPVETAWHGGPSYTAFAFQKLVRITERIGGNVTVNGVAPLSFRVSYRRLNKRGDEIVRDLVDDMYKTFIAIVLAPGQSNKKEVFERVDVSRQENRRRFIRWCIGKNLPDNVKRSYTKHQMRQTLWRVLSRRHGFHTYWLECELATLYGSTIKVSGRGRRGQKGKGTSKKTSRKPSPESVFDFSELRLSRYRRYVYGNTSHRIGIKAQSYEIASIRPYGC